MPSGSKTSPRVSGLASEEAATLVVLPSMKETPVVMIRAEELPVTTHRRPGSAVMGEGDHSREDTARGEANRSPSDCCAGSRNSR